MGRAKRKYNHFLVKLGQKLKKKYNEIGNIMPKGFTDQLFIRTFEEIFPNEWEDLKKYHKYYEKLDQNLIQRFGKARYFFPKPHRFLLNLSRHMLKKIRRSHDQGHGITYDEFKQKKRQLKEVHLAKQLSKRDRIYEKTKYIQKITPKYLLTLEREYFKTDDLQKKLDIVKEISKYNNEISISILQKVNARERDYFLRKQAFFALQNMGEIVFLRKRKKGQRKDDMLLKIYNGFKLDLNKRPEDIIKEFTENTIQHYKQFDVFLCHSSKDHNFVLELVEKFNKIGFVVYVDWISDREDLKRIISNKHTAEVIKHRLRQSRSLVYVLTENGETSRWVPWEIGYYDAFNEKVAVYNIDNLDESKIIEYLATYPQMIIRDSKIFIETESDESLFEDWING